MRHLSSLVLKNLGFRRLRTLLTILGITLGVAVILAVNITNLSATKGYEQMVDTVSGKANLRVTSSSSAGFDQDILSKIENSGGVRFAIPSTDHTSFLLKGERKVPLEIIGINPALDRKLREYRVREGSFLPSDGAFILLVQDFARQNDVRVGNSVAILTAQGPKTFKVVGLIAGVGAGVIQNGAAGFVSLKMIQNLFDLKNRIQIVDIRKDDQFTTDEVKKNVQRSIGRSFSVEPPPARSKEVEDLLKSTKQALNFFSIIAIFVGGFMIFNTFSMNLAERIREIGILKSIGSTRRQLLTIFVGEALALGLIGSVLGVFLGIFLARYIAEVMAQTAHEALGKLVVSNSSIALSLSIGLMVSLVSALYPALRASAIPPVLALSEESKAKVGWFERSGWLGGAVLIAAALFIIYVPIGPGNARQLFLEGGSLILLLGIAFLLPILISPLSRICGAPVKLLFRSEGKLAERNMHRARTRTALTVVTLMAGLTMIIGIEAMNLSYKQAVGDWIRASIGADLFVHSEMAFGLKAGKIVPMKLELKDEIEKVKGVAHAAAVKIMPVEDAKGQNLTYIAVDPNVFPKVSGTQFVKGNEEEANEMLKKGGFVLISSVLSRRENLKIGDKIRLKTLEGLRDFKIAGVNNDFTNATGTIRASYSDLKRYFKAENADSFDVKVEKGSDVEEVRKRLQREVADKYGLEVQSSKDFRRQAELEVNRVFALLDAIVLIAVIVAFLGIVNTLTMNVMERVREIGILRSIGTTRWQIGKIILAEAAILGVIGALVGIAGGVFASTVMVQATIAETGFYVRYILPVQPAIIFGVLVVVVSVLAGVYPAQKAARYNVVRAIQYE
ncbi:MAG: FtsX-like permease family protein [Actinomycetota bacterium]